MLSFVNQLGKVFPSTSSLSFLLLLFFTATYIYHVSIIDARHLSASLCVVIVSSYFPRTLTQLVFLYFPFLLINSTILFSPTANYGHDHETTTLKGRLLGKLLKNASCLEVIVLTMSDFTINCLCLLFFCSLVGGSASQPGEASRGVQ